MGDMICRSLLKLLVVLATLLVTVYGNLMDPWNMTAQAMKRAGPTCDAYCSSDGEYCDGLRCRGLYRLHGGPLARDDKSGEFDVPYCYAVRYDDCHYASSPLLSLVLTLPQHRVAKAQHFTSNDTFHFDVNASEYLKGDFAGEISVLFYNTSSANSLQVVISATFQGHVNLPTSSATKSFAKMLVGDAEVLLPQMSFSLNTLKERAGSKYCSTKSLNRTDFMSLCDSVFEQTVTAVMPDDSTDGNANQPNNATQSVLVVIAVIVLVVAVASAVVICVRRYRKSQLERLLLSIRGDQLDAPDDDAMMIDVENAVGVESDLDILAHVDDAELQPRVTIGEPPARRNVAAHRVGNSQRVSSQPTNQTRARARTSRDGRVYIALRDDEELDDSATRNTASRIRQRGFLTDADGDDLFQSETAMGNVEPVVVLGATDAQNVDPNASVLA